jgi:hypothetical protein
MDGDELVASLEVGNNFAVNAKEKMGLGLSILMWVW